MDTSGELPPVQNFNWLLSEDSGVNEKRKISALKIDIEGGKSKLNYKDKNFVSSSRSKSS